MCFKDIPVPDEEIYVKLLIAKTNSFIRRVRWKIFFAVNGSKKEEDIKGFLSRNTGEKKEGAAVTRGCPASSTANGVAGRGDPRREHYGG